MIQTAISIKFTPPPRRGKASKVAGCKIALGQSNRLFRPRGQICCEPCQGLKLAPGELIELVAPVYGLNDAPLLWHRTLTLALRGRIREITSRALPP
eukprot:6095027-Pyramimonas_sp.AAC.1